MHGVIVFVFLKKLVECDILSENMEWWMCNICRDYAKSTSVRFIMNF